jgi:PhnB protein
LEAQPLRVEPYLQFQGRCEEAFAFYRRAVGAEVVTLVRFGDMPGGPPEAAGKVMHAAVRFGDTVVMASDGERSGHLSFDGFSLSLTAADDAEAETLFAALGDGGQVRMPLSPTPFASRFGILVDRFGVSWMVVAQPAAAATD